MKIILVAAISMDGFITRHDHPGSDFTSEADSRYLREILPKFDCCVFGGASYRIAKDWMRRSLMPDKLRIAITRTPEQYAAETVPGSFEFTGAPPKQIARSLHDRGCRFCALLGGGQIYSLFLRAGCVDELWLTVEPRLFGTGTPLCPGRLDIRLELLSHDRLGGDTLLLKYRPGGARQTD